MSLATNPETMSHKLRTLFIHIPKNGGTSILQALDMPMGCGHRPWLDYNTVWPRRLYFYFKFAVVRNPWERVVSNYLYARMPRSFWHSPDGETPYGMHPDYETLRDASFQSCVELIPILKHHGWLPQSYWICNHRGKIMMDFLCRYERLAQDFAHVCRKLWIKRDLPRLNASENKPGRWQDFYDEKTATAVGRLYAADIANFSYAFPECIKSSCCQSF
jgi:chondroitin 4-sulfotransferase 11